MPDIKLKDAIDVSNDLKKMISGDADSPYRRTIEVASKLEGLPNSIGCHASACVISANPLTEYLPLMLSKKDNTVLTQYEYYDVEAIGCLKWDILGLKTLDVTQKTCELIKEIRGIDLKVDDIDVNDPSIYKVLNDGFNTGLFQFESDVAATFVQKVKPQNINELSDLTSLSCIGEIKVGNMLETPKALSTVKCKNLKDAQWTISRHDKFRLRDHRITGQDRSNSILYPR